MTSSNEAGSLRGINDTEGLTFLNQSNLNVMTDSIKYEGSWYKLRVLEHGVLGKASFGSTHLSNKVISEFGEPISKEAEIIDEQIYFYLSPSLFTLSDEELERKFF